jgi:hypothetical protein
MGYVISLEMSAKRLTNPKARTVGLRGSLDLSSDMVSMLALSPVPSDVSCGMAVR